ncbi:MULTISPECIES: CU044_5270 family protein [unclassified Spirillospora]|uniref:CU044_5270 family protein n=1 Tax=unclassified Spirillospora TaxID=2642701 RepID=UPI0037160B63
MNDLEILRDAWTEPEAPAEASRAAARTALLERASGGGRRRFRPSRFGVRLVAVGVLAAAVAVGVTVVQTAGGTDRDGNPRPVVPGIPAGPVANASEALERAARAAETRAFTPPRPDQWIYVESRVRRGREPNGPVSTDPGKDVVTRNWQRADGTKSATIEDGRLRFTGMLPTTPPSDYASLAALPADPDALLKWIYKQTGGLGAAKEGRYSTAYSMFGAILRNNVLPPRTEAAVFRAIKQIPGVTLAEGRVDAAGRLALGLGRVTDGYLHQELLLDAETYGYLGERSVVIKDHRTRHVDGTMSVEKGDLMNLTVRLKAGIVDEAGQRL